MSLTKNSPEVNKIIDKLYKNNYGTITSTLTKRFGLENFDQIESIVSKSLEEVKKAWQESNIPHDPKDTLWQFITENCSDLFCKKIGKKSYYSNPKEKSITNLIYPNEDEALENNLAMLFLSCNPVIPNHLRVPFILKTFGGYTTPYIARLFSKNQNSLSDEIKSIKVLVLNKKIDFKIPEDPKQFKLQFENMVCVIYEIFSLGFKHPDSKIKVAPDLCHLALNLAKTTISQSRTNTAETHALFALILLKASRLNSMLDINGNLLNLKEQDRTLWNKKMIKDGIYHLYKSANGKNVTKLHLEAGIAAIHATSKDYKSTNWKQIISLYDNYLTLNHSPQTELERSIAISRYKGAREGIKSINKIDLKSLNSCELLYSTLGNLYLQIHKYDKALKNYKKSLTLTENPSTRSFIRSKISICDQRIKMTKRYKKSLSF